MELLWNSYGTNSEHMASIPLAPGRALAAHANRIQAAAVLLFDADAVEAGGAGDGIGVGKAGGAGLTGEVAAQ